MTENGAVKIDPDRFDVVLDAVSACLQSRDSMVEAWNGFLKYYGTAGYLDELKRIMNQMQENPGKGAAMLRNRVMTLQHLHHWNDGLTRIVNGEIDKAPEWGVKLAELYFTAEVQK